MSALTATTQARPIPRPGWVVAAAYVVVFLTLDWVSFIRPYQGLNITPWNPHPALAIALLLWHPRWLALAWFSLLAAEVVVRGWPASPFVTMAASATLTLSYGAIAWVLRQRLDPALALATRRDLTWLTVTVIGGSLLSATLYVVTMAAGGLGPEGGLSQAIARYWIGDAVGLVVMLPMLLASMDPARRAELVAVLRSPTGWLIGALVGVLLVIVFAGSNHEPFKFFYMLFLPVVWAAARLGLAGAVLTAALTQIGLIVAVQAGTKPDLTVFELQVLMAALTMTGLLLGVAVDERRLAELKLKGSLRLAAAGQMAAALAHELSQPLTALNSYAQAARLLANASDLSPRQRLDQVTDVAERMAGDALRASEVVKRLRDFFRTGSTQLQATDVATLVDDAANAARRRAQAQGIQLGTAVPDPVQVLVDPLQIAVVLRNLLANAMDAAVAAGPAPRVDVVVARRESEVLVEVRDSGPGVDGTRLQHLFDPGQSDKPGGMGIGLSICRAIVEAHGGRLWAEPGPAGVFCLTLPVESNAPGTPSHAP